MSSTGARSWRPRDLLARAEQRSPPAVVRFALDLVRQMERMEPFDRAMTLAAQAFTSIFPLVLTALAVLPPDARGRVFDRVGETLELPDSARQALSAALPSSSGQQAAFGVLSLLVVLVSATSFSRALTRMYAKAWSVRGPGWHAPWRWIAVVLVIVLTTLGLRLLQQLAEGDVTALAGALLLTLVVNAVVWTWVPWLLLARDVRWRLLALGGLLMGVASVLLYFAGQAYLPRALRYAAGQFGALGVAFTSIGWLFVWAFVLVGATVLGVAFTRHAGPLARLLGRRGAGGAPSVPTSAPSSAPSLIPDE